MGRVLHHDGVVDTRAEMDVRLWYYVRTIGAWRSGRSFERLRVEWVHEIELKYTSYELFANPRRLCRLSEQTPRSAIAAWWTYRRAASIVSRVVLPFSFSSRLMRNAAAETPINTAKIGSATREMM